MSEKLKVEVVTPAGSVLDKDVEEVIAPGIMGEFGVLIGHTPMLTFIKPGVFSYLEGGKFIKFAVSNGFCEVLKDQVSILVEEAVSADDIDAAEAWADLEDLEKQIADMDADADPHDLARLTNKVKYCQAKIALAGA